MPILWVFETDDFVVQKGLFAIINVENFFFTIYFGDLLLGNTGGYKGLQRVIRGYKGLHRVTKGCMGLQGVTRGYGVTRGDKGLQRVTKDYRNFFPTRRFPDTFSWSILHKSQS